MNIKHIITKTKYVFSLFNIKKIFITSLIFILFLNIHINIIIIFY
jgi:hypothetical protein